MKQAISDDLISFSSLMMLAHNRGEIIQLATQLNGIIERAMEIETATPILINKNKTSSTTIKFFKEEIDKMSKTFKKEFIANGCVGRIIKRPSGKKGFYYEIRYRRNGYNISVSNKDIKKAKELFVLATHNLESYKTTVKSKFKFISIAAEWLEYKKGNLAETHTYQQYESRVARLVPDELKNKQITDIRTNDVDKAINQFANTPRMYEDLRSLYNQIFTYANASGLINHNPVTLIPFKRAERKNRNAMTEEQIKVFLQRIKEPRFDRIRNSAYMLYFFGLRPSELDEEARFENGFLICRNRKRKRGKIEYKKIPIPNQAQEFIDFDKPLTCPLCYTAFLEQMKDALGNCGLTPYNLRHTFASTCAETVREEIIEIWMGDSPERLVGRVYVHYKDTFMLEQMQTVHFII